MVETMTIGDKQYEITGRADDGLPIIKGIATSTQDGFDDEGNPKISVNVQVPSVKLGITPGEVQ